LGIHRLPWFGGYHLLAALALCLWLAGLAALIASRRRKPDAVVTAGEPRTLADLLRPRLEAAMAGQLPTSQFAELERMLMEMWRQRLGWTDLGAAESWNKLRDDAEAGPLLRQLEAWMHRPGHATSATLAELLRPYKDWVLDEVPKDASVAAAPEEQPA
jgi:hypothetical protein